MKKLYLLLVVFCCCISAGAQFTETFETFPLTQWATTGTGVTAAQNTTYFQEGLNSVKLTYVATSNGGISMSSSFNLSTVTTPKLSFWHIAAMEGTSYDHGWIEYSTDGGTNWSLLPVSSYMGNGNLNDGRFDKNSYIDWGSQFTGSTSTPGTGPATALWKHETYDLSAYSASTNFRIRFRLTSDGSVNYYGWLIDNISIQTTAVVPLSGNYSIDNTSPTAGANFNNFTDAITALNYNGISGPVVFNVSANQVFTGDIPIINRTGTSGNPITFQRSGAGANPVVKPTGLAAALDWGIGIDGGDYITFDGIDVTINTGSALEFGYYLKPITVTNGAQNNVIKNCVITLNRSNTSSRGIYQNSITSSTGTYVPTSAAGANSGNKYYNITINNVYAGIYLAGTAAFPDANNEIGTTNPANFNIIGDPATANDIGNGTVQTWGIRASNQSGVKIFNNAVSNVTYTGTSTAAIIDGMFIETFQGAGSVYNNKISGLKSTSATATSNVSGIRATHTTTGTHTLRVYNNFISGITTGYTGAASAIRALRGIYLSATGGLATQGFEIDYNSVSMDASSSPNISSACFEIATVTGPVFKVRNNIFANFTAVQAGVAKHYTWVSTSATSIGNTGSVSNYNDLYIANNTNGFVGLASADKADLAAWQAVASNDANSTSQDPLFTSSTDLHLQPSSPLDGLGTPIAGITTDIDNAGRDVINPEIGADEMPAAAAGTDMRPIALLSPAISVKGCYNTETITVTIKNNDVSPIDFSVKPVTVTVNITGPVTASYSAIVNSGTLAGGATRDVTMVTPGASLDMSSPGLYSFALSTSVAGDVNPGNNNINAERTKESLTAGTMGVSQSGYCASGTPQLTNTGANGYSSIQWQSTTTSGSGYANIPGGNATPFTVPSAITQTTYYRLVATCSLNTDPTSETEVSVNNPQVTSTTPGSRCGPGTVDLLAAGNGSDLSWYAASTGGTALGTGNTFTTPSISATTTYYVASNDGGATNFVGKAGLHSSAGTGGGITSYMNFDAISNFTLKTVDIYPFAASAGVAGTVTIELRTSTGTSIATKTVNVTSVNSTSAPAQTVVLDFPITGGASYRLGVSAWTGITNMYRDDNSISGVNITYPYTLPGVVSITGASLAGYYYFFYNWQVSNGCEGTRVPVTATVNTPPALTITPSKAICNSAIQKLEVTSTVGDFNSYIWAPLTDLYTDVAATIPYGGGNTSTVYVKASAPSAVTYTVTALNTGTSCTNTANSTVTTMPDPVIVSTTTEICTSGGATLSLDPNAPYAGGQLQWQSSSNGVTFGDIPGANAATYNPSSITQTTYYKLVLKNQAGVTCSEPAITINVTSPQLSGTTPGSRCGVGTVDLLASAPGFDVKWYAAASGGGPLSTGDVFTTPAISSNTTYYAAAATPGSGTYAVGAGATTSATYSNPFYSLWSNTHIQHLITATELNAAGIVAGNISSLGIDITAAGTLPMIDFSMKIGSTSATDMTNYVSTPLTTVYTSASLMPVTGLNMLAFTSPFYWDGSSNIVIEICHGNPSSTATMSRTALMDATSYVSTIHTHRTTGTGGTVQCSDNTTNKLTYSVRPKFTFITGCVGPRTAVLATVTPPPALTVTAGKTICNSSVHQLQVTSTVSDFNSYIWSPQIDLYTDAAATIPYTGGNASQVYVKSSVAGAQVYTLTATNTATQCANVVTSTVTVMPDPVINAAPTELCFSGTSNLSLSPASGYGAGALQWQVSTDGTIYNDIATATTANYTTPSITQTRYYKVIIKDGAGATCSQAPAFTVTVNNPQVTGTTPGSRCGTGTVTLGATGSAGATLNWYDVASGGSVQGTGNTFITPVISTNTTYYVSAEKGTTIQSYHVGILNGNLGNPFVTQTVGWGAVFTAHMNCNIQTVTVYPVGTGTVTVKILDPSNNILYTGPTTNITGTGTDAVVVPVNAILAPGNYKMGLSSTGVTNFRNETISSSIAYPFVSTPITITSGSQGTGTSGAVYYFFYDWVVTTGAVCESNRTAVQAAVTTPVSNAAGASGTTECAAKTISGSTDYNYTDCDPIAVITPAGASPVAGSVNACVTIDATVQTATTGEPYVQRHYNITPAVNPSAATSAITLYFLQAEFDAFNTASGFYAKLPTGSADAGGKANLRITQYNGTGTAPGNYTGTAVQIDPADGSISWNGTASRWEVTFNATGSGGFYVHTGKFVLPVTGLELKGELSGAANKLSWSTLTETNNKGFELQRSADGNNFSTLGFVATKAGNGNSSSLLSYSYSDAKPFAGNTYYRLKQVDKDGRTSYSNTVLLGRKVSDITLSGVYPNPAEKEVNLVILSPRTEKVTIVVTDLRGKIVMQEAAQLVNGQNQQKLDIRSLAAGTYIIKAVCTNGCETAVHRFVKQ